MIFSRPGDHTTEYLDESMLGNMNHAMDLVCYLDARYCLASCLCSRMFLEFQKYVVVTRDNFLHIHAEMI